MPHSKPERLVTIPWGPTPLEQRGQNQIIPVSCLKSIALLAYLDRVLCDPTSCCSHFGFHSVSGYVPLICNTPPHTPQMFSEWVVCLFVCSLVSLFVFVLPSGSGLQCHVLGRPSPATTPNPSPSVTPVHAIWFVFLATFATVCKYSSVDVVFVHISIN